MRNHVRHSLIVAAIAATAIAMSGCVVIKSNGSAQLDEIGAVQVTTTACASDINSNNAGYNPADADCQGSTRGGNSNLDATDMLAQLLVAYRIPTGATAPDTITTTHPGGAGAFTFNQSPTYTSSLQSASPAPAGQHWVGYISTPQNYTTAGGQYFTVSPRFTLERGADGSPFQGPFAYRVIVGMRQVNGGGLPASRPVTCGSSITTFDTADVSICADDPSPGAIATNLVQPTTDFGILDSTAVQSVKQGNVARINFAGIYAGDGGPSPIFAIDASTNVPGAVALPSTPILTPGDGLNPLRAIFRVPIVTPPGSYDVTLTASLLQGQVRSSTQELLVTRTTVRCTAHAPTIAGTRHDDVLVGTPHRDVIAAYAGDDEVLGLAGNDLICTGRGNDTIRGGGGNDRLAGRRGDDRLTGGSGRNVIDPGPGKDQMIQ